MTELTILILDDDQSIAMLLESILSSRYQTIVTNNAHHALEKMHENIVDLMLVDFNMPEMYGTEFISRARKIQPDVASVIISGNRDIDTAIDALHTGVFDFIQKPFRDISTLYQVIDKALEKRKLIIENRLYKENLEHMVQQRTKELETNNRELHRSRSRIIGILSRAAEYKDYETGQHFLRVSEYSRIIATGLDLEEDQINIIHQAAPVHDIGKIGISEKILLKQGKLTDFEFDEMKRHCEFGEEILKSESLDSNDMLYGNGTFDDFSFSDKLLETAARIAKSHHERIDGSGYPEGLRGDEIPLEARIVAIADVYDALGSSRAYKMAWSEEKCQEFIRENSGVLFDSQVVDSFFRNIDLILDLKAEIMEESKTCSYLA